jgi:hypothetical protein
VRYNTNTHTFIYIYVCVCVCVIRQQRVNSNQINHSSGMLHSKDWQFVTNNQSKGSYPTTNQCRITPDKRRDLIFPTAEDLSHTSL